MESSGGTLDPGTGGPGLPLMKTRGIPRLHRKKSGRDFTRGKQATNAKRMRLLLEKFRWDFTLGKVKKGKNSPAFCSARKVRAGFHPGKQATNSRKVTFTAGRVPTGFRSGKQATKSKKALFGTRRVRAGFSLIWT